MKSGTEEESFFRDCCRDAFGKGLEAATAEIENLLVERNLSPLWVNSRGDLIGHLTDPSICGSAADRSLMVHEAFRWGEAYFRWSGEDRLSFALPLTCNNILLGGLLVEKRIGDEDASGQDSVLIEMRGLAASATRILEREGIMNGALLRENFAESSEERLHAEALHDSKAGELFDLRSIYWRLEPELFLAMRRGDRREARRHLNQILIAIYGFGKEDVGRIKGYVLDLVTSMSRTMVECGADPTRALGADFDRFRELDAMEGYEELGHWLAEALERLIAAVETAPGLHPSAHVQPVLNYMREHCGEALSRNEMAKKAGFSPAHFSRVLRKSTGRTFQDHLLHFRVEKAARLLREDHSPIAVVADACGFGDQSRLTRSFRRLMGSTPARFRRERASRPGKG